MDAAGDFVVAWASLNQDGSSYGIYAQRYTAGGVAQGDESRSTRTPRALSSFPRVSMDAVGDFVVASGRKQTTRPWNRPGRQRYGILRSALRQEWRERGSEFRCQQLYAGNQQFPR